MVEPANVPVDIIDDDDDDEIRLPADTLAMLAEFLTDKEQREAKESDLTSQCDFEEDWVIGLPSPHPQTHTHNKQTDLGVFLSFRSN